MSIMTNNTSMSRNGRKALSTRIREACEEMGLSCAIVTDPTGQGRLMYSIGGSKPLAPGEAAHVLSIAC